MLGPDARNYQIVFLGSFLFLGVAGRDWTIHWDLVAVLFLTCLLTQALFDTLKDNDHWSWRSALITALGLSLLLRSNDYTTMAIAGFAAIASKFIFNYRGKHFFNPSNFGIIITLILPTQAWVSPGQWGTDWAYLILFISTGFLIVKKVGRWDTSGTFLLTYGLLLAGRSYWLGWSSGVWQHQIINGSVLLFAFFMISDPRSVPNQRIARIIWSVSIGILAFGLQFWAFIPSALFWSLFLLSPLTLILDQVWEAPMFTWQKARKSLRLNYQL